MKRIFSALVVAGMLAAASVALGAAPAQNGSSPTTTLTAQEAASVSAAGSQALAQPVPTTAAQLEQEESNLQPYVDAVFAQGKAADVALWNKYAPRSTALTAIYEKDATVSVTQGTAPAAPTQPAGTVAPAGTTGCNGDNVAWVSALWKDTWGIVVAKLQINADGWCWNQNVVTKVYSPASSTYNGFPNGVDTCWANYSYNIGSWVVPPYGFHMGQWGTPGVGVSGACVTTGNSGSTTIVINGYGYWTRGY